MQVQEGQDRLYPRPKRGLFKTSSAHVLPDAFIATPQWGNTPDEVLATLAGEPFWQAAQKLRLMGHGSWIGNTAPVSNTLLSKPVYDIHNFDDATSQNKEEAPSLAEAVKRLEEENKREVARASAKIGEENKPRSESAPDTYQEDQTPDSMGILAPFLLFNPKAQDNAAEKDYGFVAHTLEAPQDEDIYVVSFEDRDQMRILAYIDRYGRAFTTDKPLIAPPAREPDLFFEGHDLTDETKRQEGNVYLRVDSGDFREVGRYRMEGLAYELYDSWYDFAQHASQLSYNEAMARAYIAYVYRPRHGGAPVPERGLDAIEARLHQMPLSEALRRIRHDVYLAEKDEALRPPALACALAKWLDAAGLEELSGTDENALNLVRAKDYSDLYYIVSTEDPLPVAPRIIWGLEAALNRYTLIVKKYQERASRLTAVEVYQADNELIENVALQSPAFDSPYVSQNKTAPSLEKKPVQQVEEAYDLDEVPESYDEWNIRTQLASAFENLVIPFRSSVEFITDVKEKTVAAEILVPDESFMPKRRYNEDTQAWEETTECDRAIQALRYAMHMGLVIASTVFHVSSEIERVEFAAGYLPKPISGRLREAHEADQSDYYENENLRWCVQAPFRRDTFVNEEEYRELALSDPKPYFRLINARLSSVGGLKSENNVFDQVEDLPSYRIRNDMPEILDGPLPQDTRQRLGADWAHDLRIVYAASNRRNAENLADSITGTQNDSAAIHLVKEFQDSATDPFDFEACTRLMSALAEGNLDRHDQNAVVSCYMGTDPYLLALSQARMLIRQQSPAAVNVLSDAIMRAELSGKFTDDAEVVHRVFDSYSSRVLYNKARAQENLGGDRPEAEKRFTYGAEDAGKRVELVPDTLYMCYLEAIRLLEHSFARQEEALQYGETAIRMAPTVAAGYRQLARAYMLGGDAQSAATTLNASLRITVQPNDIALAYYQLAYALWKMGEKTPAVAAYIKSITTSPIVMLQASAELHALLSEGGAWIMNKEDLDPTLEKSGIVVAPTQEVLKILLESAAAATDANLFPVARNLLAVRMHYDPDDALINVVRSLSV